MPDLDVRLTVTGLDKVERQLRQLVRNGSGLGQAAADAVNDVAFQARRELMRATERVFDRPSPWVVRGHRVVRARPDHLVALAGPETFDNGGVAPAKVLAAEAKGGSRRDKRSEVALARVGLLPRGMQTSIPAVPYPGSEDGRGGLKGSFLTMLLSYLQAFAEVGFRANATMASRDRRAKFGRSESGAKRIGGVVFFVAYGRLRSGPTRHLAPGIWAKTGTHGADIRPVLMFTRPGAYAVRLDLERIAREAGFQQTFERRLRFRVRSAAESAS